MPSTQIRIRIPGDPTHQSYSELFNINVPSTITTVPPTEIKRINIRLMETLKEVYLNQKTPICCYVTYDAKPFKTDVSLIVNGKIIETKKTGGSGMEPGEVCFDWIPTQTGGNVIELKTSKTPGVPFSASKKIRVAVSREIPELAKRLAAEREAVQRKRKALKEARREIAQMTSGSAIIKIPPIPESKGGSIEIDGVPVTQTPSENISVTIPNVSGGSHTITIKRPNKPPIIIPVKAYPGELLPVEIPGVPSI